jgi:hypothetical protein
MGQKRRNAMNIRGGIFAIIFLVFASQSNVFAGKEFKKPEGLAQLVKDDKWGEPNNGFVTQLLPQSEECVVGEPIKFGLVLKNISDSLKQYDYNAISYHSLIIKTADNNEPYFKLSHYQTMEAPRPIGPDGIVTLFENRNITEEFVIIKPGKYRVQFRGGRPGSPDLILPASNVIEFEVKPGTPDERDFLISLLANVLPDASWHAEIQQRRRNAPAGRKEEAISIILRHPHPGRYAGIIVTLWRTDLPVEVTEQRQDAKTNDYLGKNDSGYFYIEIPPEALDYWPKMKEDIAKALKLDSQSDSSY